MTGSTAEGHGDMVKAICQRHGNDPASLIEIFHDIQAELGFIPEPALADIAQAINRTRAEVHGVMSFYHDFRRQPGGTVTVKLCRAEACQSMGALDLIEKVCARHGVTLGGTSAGGVTIEPVYCLGNCALSPAALVNDTLVGRVTPDRLDRAITEAAS